MEKSYLQYTGKGKIIIEILKKGKKETSRRRVPTVLVSMEKRFFEENDIFDARAIASYRELEKLNVHLHIEENLEESNVEFKEDITEIIENQEIEDVDNDVQIEEPVEDVESTTTEEPIEEILEETEPVVEETEESEMVKEPIEESDRAEMIAYLDATYDKDGLKDLAKEFGVEFNSRISSEKLISKLIDEKSSQILEMMK